MLHEINLLKIFLSRETCDRYLSFVDTNLLSRQSLVILKGVKRYLKDNTDSEVNLETFQELFFQVYETALDEKAVLVYKEIFAKIQQADLSSSSAKEIVTSFYKQEMATKIESLLNKKDFDGIAKEIEALANNTVQGYEFPKMDIMEALKRTDRKNGLKWKLACLNSMFDGGVVEGEFVVISGFPGSGKTAFLISEVGYMAQQLKDDEYIFWLNFEGTWPQVLTRIYTSVMNCTKDQIEKDPQRALKKYTSLMNGNSDRIVVVDFHDKSIKDAEEILKQRKPKLFVIDLIDRINGFENYINKDGGAVDRYTMIYQWARKISAEYCPVLATTQQSVEGFNKPKPSLTDLQGSKIGKQGAATAVVMIGKDGISNDRRFLSLPKNKLGKDENCLYPVFLDTQRSIYSEKPIVHTDSEKNKL